MGAAKVLQVEGALEAAASHRRDQSELLGALWSSGKCQIDPSTLNSQIWENGCAADFLTLLPLYGSL